MRFWMEMMGYPTVEVPDGYWMAVYRARLLQGQDAKEASRTLAIEEGSGSWVGGGEPSELFRRCQALSLEPVMLDGNTALFFICFPLCNLPEEGSPWPWMWNSMSTGPVFERQLWGTVELIDFIIPPELLSRFPGPRYGIQGLRTVLGMSSDEPIIATILKPENGLTPEEVAEKAYLAARAGIRFMKEGEKTSLGAHCRLPDRAPLVIDALNRAEEETGKPVMYCFRLSGFPQKIVDQARRIYYLAKFKDRERTTGIHIQFFSDTIASLSALRNSDLPPFLYVHTGGRSTTNGKVSARVWFKAARLHGADAVRGDMKEGYLITQDTWEESLALAAALRDPWGELKDTVLALSGGMNAAAVYANVTAYGPDIMPMSGGPVFDFPPEHGGPEGGVRALQQAAAAALKRMPLEVASREHEELRVALEMTGRKK